MLQATPFSKLKIYHDYIIYFYYVNDKVYTNIIYNIYSIYYILSRYNNSKMLNIETLFSIDNLIYLVKVIVIYVLLLFLFYFIKNKQQRLIYTSLIYVICIFLFNISYKSSFLYVFIALCCVITESIYIHFFDETWRYINPDIINIPYWLISMWSIAILLIIESVNKVKTKKIL